MFLNASFGKIVIRIYGWYPFVAMCVRSIHCMRMVKSIFYKVDAYRIRSNKFYILYTPFSRALDDKATQSTDETSYEKYERLLGKFSRDEISYCRFHRTKHFNYRIYWEYHRLAFRCTLRNPGRGLGKTIRAVSWYISELRREE